MCPLRREEPSLRGSLCSPVFKSCRSRSASERRLQQWDNAATALSTSSVSSTASGVYGPRLCDTPAENACQPFASVRISYGDN